MLCLGRRLTVTIQGLAGSFLAIAGILMRFSMNNLECRAVQTAKAGRGMCSPFLSCSIRSKKV